jgi:hypothetical protein
MSIIDTNNQKMKPKDKYIGKFCTFNLAGVPLNEAGRQGVCTNRAGFGYSFLMKDGTIVAGYPVCVVDIGQSGAWFALSGLQKASLSCKKS